MMKTFFFLTALILAPMISAKLDSFYTDDSTYYQKIYKDGFSLRFRTNKIDCQRLERSEIVLKLGEAITLNFPMQKMQSSQLQAWPSFYGIDEADFCWFEGRVRGQNHQKPLQYSLKIYLDNGDAFFLNAEENQINPADRLKENLQAWMTPGSLGATPAIDGGTLFKIWEPEADRVDITINQTKTYSLHKPTTPQKIHSIFLPQIKEGDEYQYRFLKNGEYEVLEVGNDGLLSSIKVDPMAKNINYDRKGGSINGYKNPRAVVTGPSRFSWKSDAVMNDVYQQEIENWIIYQLWPLTFNPKEVNGKFQGGTFKDVQEKGDYLANLGVTAVEFLPIHESRFHASWGYALDTLTLIEKNYGTPSDLQTLIDDLHQKKLKVIFDVVINHVNNSLIRDPLSKTRINTKFYRGNTPWGPKPDFNNVMVRKWITDSLLNLIRDYHVDGLRFDMIESVYKGSRAGYRFVQELNTLLKTVHPKIYLSAEQLPDNAWATFPIKDNGLGFDSQWNDKFKNFFELKFDHYGPSNRDVDLDPIKGSLMGYSNHDSGGGEYHFGGASRTLNYLGSHDFVGNKNPFIRIFSGFESFESSGTNYFFRVRPLEIPDQSEREYKYRLIHNEFNHNASLTSYGLLFTKPGASMFFQGEEFAADLNIENEWSYINARENNSIPSVDVDINRYVRSHRLQWEHLTPYQSKDLAFLTNREKENFVKYHRFFKDMIKLRRNHPEINLNDAQDVKECARGVLCYRLERGPNELFILVNYGVNLKNIWVKFPGTTTDWWEETLTLADGQYSRERSKYENIISNLGGRANNVRMAGPSISVFEKKRTATIKAPLYLRSSLNDWTASNSNLLTRASDRGELYRTKITVQFPQKIEFKLGSQDWNIDIGIPKEQHYQSMFLDATEGFLTYVPEGDNAEVFLTPGTYDFLFNIKDFKYKFIKL